MFSFTKTLEKRFPLHWCFLKSPSKISLQVGEGCEQLSDDEVVQLSFLVTAGTNLIQNYRD